jgi:hypothetical protein
MQDTQLDTWICKILFNVHCHARQQCQLSEDQMWFLQFLLVQLQIKQSVAHYFLGWLQQQLQCYYCRPITTPVLQMWGYFHNRVCVSVELSVSHKYLGYVSIWPNSLIPSFCVTVSSRLTNFGSSAPLDFQTFLKLKHLSMSFSHGDEFSISKYWILLHICHGVLCEDQCWLVPWVAMLNRYSFDEVSTKTEPWN